MIHLLLFYKITFYTLGFLILGFTIYKYLKTKNSIIGHFLFLWSAMTATAAAYVINYYFLINFNIDRSFIGIQIQGITISLIAVAVPMFVHKIFNIKYKFVLKGLVVIAILISLSLFKPFNADIHYIYYYRVMIFITITNVYSYIISFIKIIRIKNSSDKKLGLSFILSFLIFFGILYLIDISTLLHVDAGFMFFPLFYVWVGGFCIYIGYKKLNLSEKTNKNSIDDFITKYKLTKRESEIALLLVDGLTYREISEKLCISSGTVSTHIRHIYDKTETSSKIQLNKEISKFR